MVVAKSLQPTAGGLCEAFRSAIAGDEALLLRWWSGGAREIERVLRRHGLDPCEAEDGTQRVLIEVWGAVTRRKTVRCELAWLARLIRNIAADVIRARPSQLETCTVDPDVLLARSDLPDGFVRRDSLRHALLLVRSLPPPYAQIAEAQSLRGMTRDAIRKFLQTWSENGGRPIGVEQVRWLIRETHRMLRELGHGVSPVERWPRRFTRKTVWNSTPPPAFSGQEGVIVH